MRSHHHSTVVAYLALIVAMGGTSYAAVSLPRNSVGAKQIKTSAVRSPDVKDGSLEAKDFNVGQLPVGATGPAGGKGDTGATGAPGPVYGAQAATGENPSATYSTVMGSATLQLPGAGKVYAYAHVRVNAVCASGAMTVGLYLSDVAIPGTGQLVGSATTAEVTLSGLSAPVSGGTRTLRVAASCTGGVSTAGTTIGPVTVGGLLVNS